jgi:DNA (cytosine-5)-methyltransferase 1
VHYYNEIDKTAVAWLRNLIGAGLLPEGDVDERSITEVQASDLRGYTQCHFFAGIGGWSLALALAGWPSTRPVWTGSCPCQPFSTAGRHTGEADKRHLFPEFRRLIEECRPPVVFGEQVASRAGRAWLSRVRTDLEALAYGVGASDLCAASIGAPHIRQRLYWVADTQCSGLMDATPHNGEHVAEGRPQWDAPHDQREPSQGRGHESPWADSITIPCLDGKGRRTQPRIRPLADGVPGRVGQLRAYGNAIVPQVAAEFIMAYMEVK